MALSLKDHRAAPPTPLTNIIGRDPEIETIFQLLRHPGVRLLTLTGPGGIGKTRLALQTAVALADDFEAGITFVPLAAISDPNLVIPTIARTLGLREEGVPPLEDRLKIYLQSRQQLLLLDNFEQVIMAGPLLLDIITNCPDLKILLTSREVLRIRGEQEFAVPPLTLPDLPRLDRTGLNSASTLANYAAVALFVERVRGRLPHFQPTPEDLRAIAQICARLDGLPLAIELAAARLRLMSPQALLKQLGGEAGQTSLQVLTGGPRDLPARQRTLRHAIQWSYDLLELAEQRLFRYLSIFVGGFTLEAAESVIEPQLSVIGEQSLEITAHRSPITVFGGIASLVEKSMLQQAETSTADIRFSMLATVREFGLEQLRQNGETETLRRAHAAYFLDWAEQAETNLAGPEQKVWIARLEQDYHNLETMLRWALRQGEAEMVLRLGYPLRQFWMFQGYMVEMRFWMQHARKIAAEGLPRTSVDLMKLSTNQINHFRPDLTLRARAFLAMGWMTYGPGDLAQGGDYFEKSLILYQLEQDYGGIAGALLGLGRTRNAQGELVEAQDHLEESLRLYRAEANPVGIAEALYGLGRVAWSKGDYVTARAHHEEALAQYKALGRQWDVAMSHYVISWVALFQGDLDTARWRIEQAIALFRAMDSQIGVGITELWLGWVLGQQGDYASARPILEKSLALGRERDAPRTVIYALIGLADVALAEGDAKTAESHYREAVDVVGDRQFVALALEGLGVVNAHLENWAAAARWLGAAAALRRSKSLSLPPFRQVAYNHNLETIRRHLDPADFQAAWAEGPERYAHLIGEKKATEISPLASAPALPDLVEPLTPRELEVLRLVAQGLTNAQVGEQLVISPRTVDAHLRSIYGKLNVTSRAAATRFAFEHQLV